MEYNKMMIIDVHEKLGKMLIAKILQEGKQTTCQRSTSVGSGEKLNKSVI